MMMMMLMMMTMIMMMMMMMMMMVMMIMIIMIMIGMMFIMHFSNLVIYRPTNEASTSSQSHRFTTPPTILRRARPRIVSFQYVPENLISTCTFYVSGLNS